MVAPVSRTHRHGTLPPEFAAWLAIRTRGPVCERQLAEYASHLRTLGCG